MSIGVATQPHESLFDADSQLLGEHSGCLVDLGPVQRQRPWLPGWAGPAPGVCRCLCPVMKQQHGGGIGEDKRVTQVVRAQRTGLRAVEIEDPDSDAPDLQWQREHRRSAR